MGVRRQRIFLHLAGLGIKPPHQIAELPNPPDRAVLRLDRIARALAERRHDPFGERDLQRAGHDLGRPPVVFRREMLGQITGDRGLLIRHARQIDHRADEFLPALAGVAGALRDHVGLVAAGADTRDQFLAGAVGQCRRLALSLRGERHQHADRGSHQRQRKRLRASRRLPTDRLLFPVAFMLVPGDAVVKRKAARCDLHTLSRMRGPRRLIRSPRRRGRAASAAPRGRAPWRS